MGLFDVTDAQILGLDPAVDQAPSDWGLTTGTEQPPTSMPTSVMDVPAGNATMGGATPWQWANLLGGIASATVGATAAARNRIAASMPSGFYRDPRTGATIAVGAGGPPPIMPAPQQNGLVLLLLLGGLVLLARR